LHSGNKGRGSGNGGYTAPFFAKIQSCARSEQSDVRGGDTAGEGRGEAPSLENIWGTIPTGHAGEQEEWPFLSEKKDWEKTVGGKKRN